MKTCAQQNFSDGNLGIWRNGNGVLWNENY